MKKTNMKNDMREFWNIQIKAAPTELIDTLTFCYKQFAPTELEEQLIHIPKSAYEIDYSLYKQFLYLKLKENFTASIQFDKRGLWTVCNKAAPKELIGSLTFCYKQFAPTELEEVFIHYVRVICEAHVLIIDRSLLRSSKNTLPSIRNNCSTELEKILFYC